LGNTGAETTSVEDDDEDVHPFVDPSPEIDEAGVDKEPVSVDAAP